MVVEDINGLGVDSSIGKFWSGDGRMDILSGFAALCVVMISRRT